MNHETVARVYVNGIEAEDFLVILPEPAGIRVVSSGPMYNDLLVQAFRELADGVEQGRLDFSHKGCECSDA